MFSADYSWYEICSFELEAEVCLCTLLIFVLSVEFIGALKLEEFWCSNNFFFLIYMEYELFLSQIFSHYHKRKV